MFTTTSNSVALRINRVRIKRVRPVVLVESSVLDFHQVFTIIIYGWKSLRGTKKCSRQVLSPKKGIEKLDPNPNVQPATIYL